jgi:hypothetical protein
MKSAANVGLFVVFDGGGASVVRLLLPPAYPAGAGRTWLGVMNRTTISAYGAFSIGRVPVGRGQ